MSQPLLPLVSVVIPAYECERYIVEALDSVFAQDYVNLEVIVINDGSTDTTLELLKEYKHKITILDQSNSGSAVARNAGMAIAKGDYIAFLDSDDKWLPGKLQAQVNFLEQNLGFGLVCSNWVTWSPDENGDFHSIEVGDDHLASQDGRHFSGWLYCDLLFDCVVWTSSVLIRRTIFEQVGDFNAHLRRGQDYDYWIRASRITKMHKLDQVYAIYRMNNQSVTNRPNEINFGYKVLTNAINKWGYQCVSGKAVDKKLVERYLAEVCFSFAYYHLSSGSINVARNSIFLSLKHNPFKFSYWLYLGFIGSRYLKPRF
ncbi:MAG: glycosyltransferase [Pseudomonadales bacterium]|nr:glycosyltransferase [Pseudomonadales bacterium]